jgi:histidine triad (HIT) family protein
MHNHLPANYDCPFCQIASSATNSSNLTVRAGIVLQDKFVTAFVSLHWWPNNPGHVLVIPNDHYENIYDIPDKALHQVQSAGKRIALAMKATYQCEGTSFRQHNEPAGNQDVWHYHLHVFPRYVGDDLYVLTGSRRRTSSEERQPYAEKLRDYFANH